MRGKYVLSLFENGGWRRIWIDGAGYKISFDVGPNVNPALASEAFKKLKDRLAMKDID